MGARLEKQPKAGALRARVHIQTCKEVMPSISYLVMVPPHCCQWIVQKVTEEKEVLQNGGCVNAF